MFDAIVSRMYLRNQTRAVTVRGLRIGGGAPVSVQSMTKTDTADVKATVTQIVGLAAAGCELVRVAVPGEKEAKALREIVRESPIPVCADIHFDHRLALMALDAGADKLRLNPGNIGGEERVRVVVKEALSRRVPVRIGVNSGSVEKEILRKYGRPCAKAMVESALGHVRILEDMQFFDIVVSLKAADVATTVEAGRLMAGEKPYPLHLGVTEAGSPVSGAVKSAMGIGVLLLEGLGDTIRVSLTADPLEEVRIGYEILKSAGLRRRGPVVISCPTCGRTSFDLIGKVNEIEKRIQDLRKYFTIAVMGCEVNGPGEARAADLGIAGGGDKAALFKKGSLLRVVPFDQFVDAVTEEARKMEREIEAGEDADRSGSATGERACA